MCEGLIKLAEKYETQGKLAGKLEGKIEGKIEAFFSMGLQPDEIAQKMGLSTDAVNEILIKNNLL